MTQALLYKLKEVLPEYKLSTLKNMLMIVQAILQKETICLYKLKSNIGAISEKPKTKASSHYRKITRFFKAHALSSI
ncbi:MAG: hypothetical protein KTR26_10470 [Flammeovirgaceae bacterium]|nr:hypothetical protein [Flammeovirgaceae bacterium]